jgi:hypothetical protein
MYQSPINIFYRPEMSFVDTSTKQFSINRQKSKLFADYLKKSDLKNHIVIHEFKDIFTYEDLKLGHTEEYLTDFFNSDPRVEASI